MAEADATLVIDGKMDKAQRELVKLDQVQEKVEKTNKRMGTQFKRTEKQSDDMSKGLSRVHRNLVAIGASAVSLAAVARGLQAIDDKLKSVARSSDQSAQGWVPFIVQKAGQPGAARDIARAKITAADLGMISGQGGDLANIIGATQGANFEKDFPLAGRMVGAMGVDPQAAGSVIGTAVMRNMDTDVAASRFLKAVDLSRVNPAQMARVVGMTTGYRSMEEGLAVATALAPAVEPERLPAAVEAASRTFMKDESKLAKKFRLSGMGASERLNVLYGAMGTGKNETEFIRTVAEKYDLGEEEGRALRALLMNRGAVSSAEAAIMGVGGGGIEARYQAMRRDDPSFRAEYDSRRARLLNEVGTELGIVGGASRGMRAIDQFAVLRMQRRAPTIAPLLTNDEGQLNTAGRFAVGPAAMKEADNLDPGKMLIREINLLREELIRNSDATRENSNVTGSGTPSRNANI